jgi:hypothetical protein
MGAEAVRFVRAFQKPSPPFAGYIVYDQADEKIGRIDDLFFGPAFDGDREITPELKDEVHSYFDLQQQTGYTE